MCFCLPADVRELLRNILRTLSPRQIHIHVLGGDLARIVARAAEVYRRIGTLHARQQHLAFLDVNVLALEIDRIAAECAPESRQPFASQLIASLMGERQSLEIELA